MEIKWIIIGIAVIGAVFLIWFLIKQNLKDEKDYEEFLNKDYKKPGEKESELNNDDDEY